MMHIINKIKKFFHKHENEASVVGAAATEALKLSFPGMAVPVEAVKAILRILMIFNVK